MTDGESFLNSLRNDKRTWRRLLWEWKKFLFTLAHCVCVYVLNFTLWLRKSSVRNGREKYPSKVYIIKRRISAPAVWSIRTGLMRSNRSRTYYYFAWTHSCRAVFVSTENYYSYKSNNTEKRKRVLKNN